MGQRRGILRFLTPSAQLDGNVTTTSKQGDFSKMVGYQDQQHLISEVLDIGGVLGLVMTLAPSGRSSFLSNVGTV